MELKHTPEYAVYKNEACEATCLLTALAPKLDNADRAPVSVSLVLDRSGSMSGRKLELVKRTCTFLLKQLGPRDRLSVVAFDSEVMSVYPLTDATSGSKVVISQAINGIQAGSATNLSGGLFKGLAEQLEANTVHGTGGGEDWSMVDAPAAAPGATANASGAASTVKSVFLFTDGEANQGLTNAPEIINIMNNMLSSATANGGAQIKVHTFGFGEQHNSDLLASIASAASGTYYFIQTPENIPEAFADALGGLLSVCAQNVELRITPLNSAAIKCVHTGFSQRHDGADAVVTVPDLFAEESKDVVVDISLPRAANIEAESDLDVAEVTMRFLDVLRGNLASKHVTITLRRALAPPEAPPHRAVAVHRARLTTAARMREAEALADAGNYAGASSALQQQVAEIDELLVREASVADSERLASELGGLRVSDTLQALRGDLQRCARVVNAPAVYASSGKKYTSAMSTAHGCQRSVGFGYSRPAAPRSQPAQMMQQQQAAPRARGRFGMFRSAAPPPPPAALSAPAPAGTGLYGAPSGGGGAYGMAAGAPPPARGGALYSADNGNQGPSDAAAMNQIDEEEDDAPVANMYANSRQRELVQSTIDATK